MITETPSNRKRTEKRRGQREERHLTLVMEEESRTVQRMGDYSITKYYDVINPDGSLADDINGIVVQIVEKTSEADTDDESLRSLTTTADFMNFTTGRVNSMCESYIEMFTINDGTSTDGDAFANGAVSKYLYVDDRKIKKEEEKWTALINKYWDGYVGTSGRITQRGINYLFTDPEKISIIKTLPWNNSKNTPANGLPYISIANRKTIEDMGTNAVNIPIHTVTAIWDKDNLFTDFSTTFELGDIRKGGKNKRNTRKTRE